MTYPPVKCPKCGEPNNTGINYCAVCGSIFPRSAGAAQSAKRGKMSAEMKLKLKKEKKRKELTDMFKSKKISLEQYRKGMNKLGYATDADKAEAFKKFIRGQIKDLQKMDVAPKGMEGQSHFDPYQSNSDLPRDAGGNVITEFSVTTTRAPDQRVDAPVVVETQDCAYTTVGSGPLFGESLFAGSGTSAPGENVKPEVKTPKETPRIYREETKNTSPARGSSRRRRQREWEMEEDDEADVEFDEDLTGQEEEFSIDLEEENAWWDDESDEWWDEEEDGESGWWDDDEWELELDEEEEDWDLDEEETITTSDGTRISVEFDEEEEEEFFEVVDDDEDEDDDDDFEISLSSRKRRRSNR